MKKMLPDIRPQGLRSVQNFIHIGLFLRSLDWPEVLTSFWSKKRPQASNIKIIKWWKNFPQTFIQGTSALTLKQIRLFWGLKVWSFWETQTDCQILAQLNLRIELTRNFRKHCLDFASLTLSVLSKDFFLFQRRSRSI